MLPAAPGRLSITTGRPSAVERGGATIRATVSFALPAPNGTTRRSGLAGNWACADATTHSAAASAARPAQVPGFIAFLPRLQRIILVGAVCHGGIEPEIPNSWGAV